MIYNPARAVTNEFGLNMESVEGGEYIGVRVAPIQEHQKRVFEEAVTEWIEFTLREVLSLGERKQRGLRWVQRYHQLAFYASGKHGLDTRCWLGRNPKYNRLKAIRVEQKEYRTRGSKIFQRTVGSNDPRPREEGEGRD